MGEAASMVVVVGAEGDGKGLSKSGGGGGEVVMSAVVWDRGWVDDHPGGFNHAPGSRFTMDPENELKGGRGCHVSERGL